MQIAKATSYKAPTLPSRAAQETSFTAGDSVELGSYRERLASIGMNAGTVAGLGLGLVGGMSAASQGIIQTGDPVGDVLLNISLVTASMAGGCIAGAVTMGCQGYALGWLADRCSGFLNK